MMMQDSEKYKAEDVQTENIVAKNSLESYAFNTRKEAAVTRQQGSALRALSSRKWTKYCM